MLRVHREGSAEVTGRKEDNGSKSAESLYVWIRGQSNTGDVKVGSCCRPPDQEKELDEACFIELEEASQ